MEADRETFQRIYDAVSTVPMGKVVTYGQIARHLGLAGQGARTVGWAMRDCPKAVPWHRVVNSEGRISLKGHGYDLQHLLLEDEGIEFDATGRIDLTLYGWDEI